MTVQGADIVDCAIDWHLRLSTASEHDWLRFTEWLEADAEHAAAYNRVLEDDILAAPMLNLATEAQGSVVRIEGRRDGWRKRRGWIAVAGGALAASMAAMVYLPSTQPGAAAPSSIVTAPGEKREMTLADGSRVEMNGGTELVMDSPRQVSLVRGQAVFHVRHNPAAPFQVAIGDVVLRDVGTVFDVSNEAGRLGVQVAEGAVTYQPDRERLTLHKGMALSARAGDDRILVRSVPAEAVGGWRQGRLAFREAALREVAAEIRRTTGHDLTVATPVADMPFTGSIRLAGNAEQDATHVANLTGLSARRAGSGWILTSTRDAPN
ncbi:FecR domain-containing protein [Sphingomonas sp.]|uniref:FecR family protein n=1 Tax=Sphingomonas sp. TaxID=28214 RepID=UPI0025D1693B|nr:FecR domain-containing protein [Sphingomonas sp.]